MKITKTVRYEVKKLCTGSVQDSNGWYLAVLNHYEAIDVIESFTHFCLYKLKKVEIWAGVTDPLLTGSLTDFERQGYSAPYKYKSGALVTQLCATCQRWHLCILVSYFADIQLRSEFHFM